MGRTQVEVSSAAGIAQPSLQKYEKGQASLSKEVLIKMGETICLDPEYISGRAQYPFKSSSGLIKMFAQEGEIFKSLLDPLYLVADFSSKIDLICLVAPAEMLSKIYRKISLPWIFALAFKDDRDNIFLIRGKKERDLINLAVSFPALIFNILKSKCVFSIAQKEVTKKLFDKIRNWGAVSRKDIAALFAEKDVDFKEVNKDLTYSEARQLIAQRNILRDTLSELDLVVIKAMREEKVSHEAVLKFINSRRSSGS
ncbi:MAG TPA: helix-turn-helix transcriptional regulator [Syntrophales bacterium]|nr:helix-turn-helix transcriptional regulator [Syntrophales bacterium]